jgi:hypothetical protein
MRLGIYDFFPLFVLTVFLFFTQELKQGHVNEWDCIGKVVNVTSLDSYARYGGGHAISILIRQEDKTLCKTSTNRDSDREFYNKNKNILGSFKSGDRLRIRCKGSEGNGRCIIFEIEKERRIVVHRDGYVSKNIVPNKLGKEVSYLLYFRYFIFFCMVLEISRLIFFVRGRDSNG